MKKISVVAMSVAILLLIGSCAQRNGKEETAKPTAPVTKVTETPTPTATATPTANPNAKPIPGSCLVLEERYCKTVIYITDHGYILAAYKLPVGTLIFSPYGGSISAAGFTTNIDGKKVPVPVIGLTTVKSENKKTNCLCGTDFLEGYLVGAMDRKSLLSVKPILGDIKEGILTRISKGQVLARAGETNIKINSPLDALNTYNLVMYFMKDGSYDPDNAKTKAVFGISQQK